MEAGETLLGRRVSAEVGPKWEKRKGGENDTISDIHMWSVLFLNICLLIVCMYV